MIGHNEGIKRSSEAVQNLNIRYWQMVLVTYIGICNLRAKEYGDKSFIFQIKM